LPAFGIGTQSYNQHPTRSTLWIAGSGYVTRRPIRPTLISIGEKLKCTSARRALEVVKKTIAHDWGVEDILQGICGSNDRQPSLAHYLDQLAHDFQVFVRTSEIARFCEAEAFGAVVHF
jgi:hypothetical protein